MSHPEISQHGPDIYFYFVLKQLRMASVSIGIILIFCLVSYLTFSTAISAIADRYF